jgi:arsenate reductase
MSVTIYHNPNCSTSRKVLETLRNAGHEPTVIEYLKTPPTRAELLDLLKQMNMGPREILRRKGTLYEELGLADPQVSEVAILDAIDQHPILIERPIVVSEKGVRLCRPAEKLAEIVAI